MNSRWYEHNVAYDRTSITENGAARWYAAIHSDGGGSNDGLYRSEDYGETWTRVGTLTGGKVRFYGIQTHPADGQTVYAATNLGLYVSNSKGTDLVPLGDLPAGEVSSIAVNPVNGNIIYAVVLNNGLYKSVTGVQHSANQGKSSATHVFINPGFPDVIYFERGKQLSTQRRQFQDGGQTWEGI